MSQNIHSTFSHFYYELMKPPMRRLSLFFLTEEVNSLHCTSHAPQIYNHAFYLYLHGPTTRGLRRWFPFQVLTLLQVASSRWSKENHCFAPWLCYFPIIDKIVLVLTLCKFNILKYFWISLFYLNIYIYFFHFAVKTCNQWPN